MCNIVIFENFRPSSKLTIHLILEQLHRHKVKVAPRPHRNLIGMAPVYDFPVSFFYGASTNRVGGIGDSGLALLVH